ncbi:MAG: hypothetical protein LBP19_05255 [Treponema sp.]|jgi:hypothetical protein|nr:hypothetical protein [Treponema sp.]
MLIPFGTIGKARAVAVAEQAAEEIEPESPPSVQEQKHEPDKQYIMQYPDMPLGRRRGFCFECLGKVLYVVNGKTTVDAETAALLEKSGWIRKEIL